MLERLSMLLLKGAALGSRSNLKEYVSEKLVDWVNEETRLAEFAVSQPQALLCGFHARAKGPLDVLFKNVTGH